MKRRKGSDQWARPTNGPQREERDRIMAENGKTVAACPGCRQWRWFEPATIQMPDFLCDECITFGVPREMEHLAKCGELTSRQRHKKV